MSNSGLVNINITRNVCTKKKIFVTYKEVDGEILYIKNPSTSKVLGIEKVRLKMYFMLLILKRT
jgi:hypothetical protein